MQRPSQGILIVEDEVVLAKNIKRYLQQHGYEARVAVDGAVGLHQFDEFKPDLVLLDFNLPGNDGLDVLRRIHQLDSRVKVILITAHGNAQVAVDAMKAGAYDYLSKPLVLSELKLIIDKAVGQERLEGALSYYREREAGESGLAKILGRSTAVTQLKQRVRQLLEAERRLADNEPPAVLITGETGTGKELVARSLHYDGLRRNHPFVEINCASITADLLESELFGYERGAFTGARERKLGLVESADRGTLFLDEIAELDLAVQAKLLKLLDDKIVRRLGSLRERKVDLRIIAATNRRLDDLVREGRFRSDLYYRLGVVSLELPPLRQRGTDVLLLAGHFLALHGRRYRKPGLKLGVEARDAVLRHLWPGNVRELRNVMEQCALMAADETIEAATLPLAPNPQEFDPSAPESSHADPLSARSNGGRIAEVERGLIVAALDNAAGNVTRAAEALGITRDTLRYRMDKYKLRAPH